MLVIAAHDPVGMRKMVAIARQLNPPIELVLRTDDTDEARLFERDRLGRVFVGEQELALGISRHILERKGVSSGEPAPATGGETGAEWEFITKEPK